MTQAGSPPTLRLARPSVSPSPGLFSSPIPSCVHALRELCLRAALADAVAVRLCRDGVRGGRAVGNRRLPPCRSACRVDGGLFHHCRGHLRHDNQPYLFFWQASEEVEDEEGDPAAEPLLKAPAQAPRQLRRMRLDTMVGMGVSNLVALFIVLTTAATLHAHGVTNVETSADAAKAL